MSRTYHRSRLSDAGLLPPDRMMKQPTNDLRAPVKAVKKLTHHRERQSVARALSSAVTIERCTATLNCQCAGCVEFWNRIHAASAAELEVFA